MKILSTLRLSFGNFMAVLISLSSAPYFVIGFLTPVFKTQVACGFLAVISFASGIAVFLFSQSMEALDASDTEMAIKVKEDNLARAAAAEESPCGTDTQKAWFDRAIGLIASFVELLDPPAKQVVR